jgi:disulfide bond formation protein DsbB
MNLFTPRLSYLYGFLCILGMLALGFYLQFWKGIAPCPLCLLQRIMMFILGIIFLFGMTLSYKKYRYMVIGALAMIFSVFGAMLAARQVWIQHLPANQSPDCGVSLEYMLHVLPLDQVLKKIFSGTAECSLVDWSIWGFSLAQLTLVTFIFLTVFAFWQMIRKQ